MEQSRSVNESLGIPLPTEAMSAHGAYNGMPSPNHTAETLVPPDSIASFEWPCARELIADYHHATDEQLLDAARRSDTHAFAELSGRKSDMLRKRVFRIVRNYEDTEDVVQDSLLNAYVHLSDFRGSCNFSTWLVKIATNCALMLLRKRRSVSLISINQRDDKDSKWEVMDIPDPAPSAERRYSRREALDLLQRAVNHLPLSYRSVLEQYHGQERSVQETADAVGISVPTAKSRLLRARVKLRFALEGQHISPADAS